MSTYHHQIDTALNRFTHETASAKDVRHALYVALFGHMDRSQRIRLYQDLEARGLPVSHFMPETNGG